MEWKLDSLKMCSCCICVVAALVIPYLEDEYENVGMCDVTCLFINFVCLQNIVYNSSGVQFRSTRSHESLLVFNTVTLSQWKWYPAKSSPFLIFQLGLFRNFPSDMRFQTLQEIYWTGYTLTLCSTSWILIPLYISAFVFWKD